MCQLFIRVIWTFELDASKIAKRLNRVSYFPKEPTNLHLPVLDKLRVAEDNESLVVLLPPERSHLSSHYANPE